MSVIHNIINKRPLDISRLDKFVSTIDGATYEDRGEGVFYFWINGKSTRGFYQENTKILPFMDQLEKFILANGYTNSLKDLKANS